METRRAGQLVVLAALVLYIYYTVWVLITPFVEEGQPILKLFGPRYFAVALPVLAGAALFGTTAITLGCFLVATEVQRIREYLSRARSKSQ